MSDIEIGKESIGGYKVYSKVDLSSNKVTLWTFLRVRDPKSRTLSYLVDEKVEASGSTPGEAALNLKEKLEKSLSRIEKAGHPVPSRDAVQILQLASFPPLKPVPALV